MKKGDTIYAKGLTTSPAMQVVRITRDTVLTTWLVDGKAHYCEFLIDQLSATKEAQ
jgi:hypothetical protein